MRFEDFRHAPRDPRASPLRVHVRMSGHKQPGAQHEPELVTVSRSPTAKRREVERGRLCQRDEVSGRHHLHDAEAETHVLDHRAQVGQRLDRRADVLADLGIAGVPEIARHADAQPAHAGLAIEWHRTKRSCIRDGARDRPRVVEAGRQRDQALRAQQPERRLVAGHAAECRGEPDGSSGVGAECPESQTRSQRGAGSRAGAAWRPVRIPGVARRREVVGERRRREAEFVGGELAENDRALGSCPGHEVRLAPCDMTGEQLRAGGGRA